MRHMMKRYFNKRTFTIFFLALIVRCLFVGLYPGLNYYGGISKGYTDVAENVVDGKGFVLLLDMSPLGSAQPQWEYVTFIDRPLGYVLFIASIFFLVKHAVIVQIVQAIVGAVNCLLVAAVGRKLLNETLGYYAGLLAALWPVTARFEISLLPGALISFFLLTSAVLILSGIERRRWQEFIYAGLLLGVATLMRPDVVLLAPFLTLGFIIQQGFRRGFRSGVLVTAAVIAVLFPHSIRNYVVSGGYFVPLGIGSGVSLWEGISQFGDAHGTVYGDERVAKLEGYRFWAYPDGVKRDRKRFREALEIIREHPAWYLGVMLRRVPVLLTANGIFNIHPKLWKYLEDNPGKGHVSYLFAHPVEASLKLLIKLAPWILIAFAVVGMWHSRYQWRTILVPLLILFYYVIIHITTNTEARYFYPVVLLLFPFAVFAFSRFRETLSTWV